MKKLNSTFQILSALVLASCSSVIIPNVESCTTAGVIAAGADCAETQTLQTHWIPREEWIEFLTPNKDRAGAMCISPDEYTKMKTALEQACAILGSRCKFDPDRYTIKQ